MPASRAARCGDGASVPRAPCARVRGRGGRARLLRRVAVAGLRFQPGAVQCRDPAAAILDESRRLQLSGGCRDALAAYAEQVGNRVLGQRDVVGAKPVHAGEEQAAQLFHQRVVAVAHAGLRHLPEEGLRVAEQQLAQRRGSGRAPAQRVRAYPISVSGIAHDDAARRRAAAHRHGDSRHPFIARERDFDRRPVAHFVDHGDDSGGREPGVTRDAVRLAENLPARQRNPFQMRSRRA